MTPPAEPPFDLTNCDREPIHVPGSIQPHGALLALSLPDLVVEHVSENVRDLLGATSEAMLGATLSAVLGPVAAELVRNALAADELDEVNPLSLEAAGTVFDGIVHRTNGLALLELERTDLAVTHGDVRTLGQVLSSLQRATTRDELYAAVARQVRRLTGFERVLLYRFDEDGSGIVEAEVKPDALDAYLGLRYPASDVPRPARELYLKNWVRIIPNRSYTPVPIMPSTRPGGEALDLSQAVLRSVSPIHREYMANMGVQASMSASLVVQGRLWGLINCLHHAGPHFVSYAQRAAFEVIARLVSLRIAALEELDSGEQRSQRRRARNALSTSMRQASPARDVLVALIGQQAELLSLVRADGAAALGPTGEPVLAGSTPGPEVVVEIARWLEARGSQAPFSTHALPSLLHLEEEDARLASGLLAIALPGEPTRRLLWFRKEIVQTVT